MEYKVEGNKVTGRDPIGLNVSTKCGLKSNENGSKRQFHILRGGKMRHIPLFTVSATVPSLHPKLPKSLEIPTIKNKFNISSLYK